MGFIFIQITNIYFTYFLQIINPPQKHFESWVLGQEVFGLGITHSLRITCFINPSILSIPSQALFVSLGSSQHPPPRISKLFCWPLLQLQQQLFPQFSPWSFPFQPLLQMALKIMIQQLLHLYLASEYISVEIPFVIVVIVIKSTIALSGNGIFQF